MEKRNCFLIKWIYKTYGWATELLYHQLAWAYDAVAWLVSFGNWHQWRLLTLEHLLSGKILEVGFGTGELLLAMACRGLNVIGLEKSRQMHRVLTRKLKGKNLSIPRTRGSVQDLPFPSGSFKNVISTFPSGYILQKESINEIYRVLKQNGRLIVVGLFVVFKPAFLRLLTRWYLGAGGSAFMAHFTRMGEEAGFTVSVITISTRRYKLPIVIMERGHE